VRYIGSARSGLPGTDPWAWRSFSSVRDGGSVPGFRTARLVRKEHHLDAAVARVVAVGDRVDDRLRHDLFGDLVAHRRLRAGLAGPDREGDLAQDEVHRRVHEVEDRALVDLVGRDRFGHPGAVEVSALDLG